MRQKKRIKKSIKSHKSRKIPKHEIWNLKNAISRFMVPRLNGFIQMIKNGETMAIPNWIDEEGIYLEKYEDQVYIDILNEEWIIILNKILFVFEYETNCLKYSHLTPDEIYQQQEHGLELFAKYFHHLWD